MTAVPPALSVGCAVSGIVRAERSKPVPSAAFRYNDPSTDFPVVRLTDPAFTSRLPASYNRAVPRHGNFMLYSADFTGRMEAYRMDAKGRVSSTDRNRGARSADAHAHSG